MRKVAIVGAGVSGLVTAHALLRAGCAVTVYSDRTPEQWLNNSRPTGTAARFADALSFERELGLDHWQGPPVYGAHTVVSLSRGNRLATLTGRQELPGMAIDVRLQNHRWMLDLEARGGRLLVEHVTLDRLDAIAAGNDLTLVASGKADLSELFERDAVRSGFDRPQRNVAMIVVKGPSLRLDGVPFSAVRQNILDGVGEAVWIPYLHRDVGPCWNLIFEARPDGPMDLFKGAKSGAEALDAARRVIAELLPWDAAWARDMELADDLGWLVGSITPTVRKPVGRLPSGRLVACIGDAAMLFDPLAAQGANNGVKMARHLAERVAAHGEAPFDAAWMTATFESFWEAHGRAAFELTNLMLGPMPRPGLELVLAQYGSNGVGTDGRQLLANAFAIVVADPPAGLRLLREAAATRDLIATTLGAPWWWCVARGAMGIVWAQLRQLLGLEPGHPRAPDDLPTLPTPSPSS